MKACGGAVLLLLLPLLPSCRQDKDSRTKPSGPPQEPAADEWKSRRVCKWADKIPVIDSHINMSPESLEEILALNREWRVKASVNVMGGYPGHGLEDSVAILAQSGGRIEFMCNIDWTIFGEDYFTAKVLADLVKCREKGAVGIKIFKSLGLGITWPDGKLLKVDDPVLDPVFEKAGSLGLAILIHSGDPRAFFKPFNKNNERYDELEAHPSWRFDGEEFPSWEELYMQFGNRVARHPETRFIGSHFGNNPEDPPAVFAMMEKYPNLYVNTSARIPEIGRLNAEKMNHYFKKYGDRILYGSDLGIGPEVLVLGSSPPLSPSKRDIVRFFNASYRYFETRDRQFDHPTPIQGRWKIDGIGLDCGLLHKIYHENAERLFGVKIEE